MKKALLLAAGISLFIVACSKDDNNDPDPDPPTPQQITFITNNIWKIDSMGYDNNSDGKIDAKLNLPTCSADNTLKFNVDSTGAFGEGATKCAPSDPQDTPITWKFKDNTYTVVTMDGLATELDGDVKVLTLTESNLVLSAPPGISGTLIVVLKE